MTTKAWFTQSDITRMCKAVMASGLQVHSIQIEPKTRTISVITKTDADGDQRANPLDRLHRS